jgi:hypothetical protein
MSLLRDIASIATDVAQFFVNLETKALIAKSIGSEVKNACFWGGIYAVVLLMLLAGIGSIIAGAWILLASVTSAGLAGVIVGLIVAIIATALIITAKSCLR